MDIPPSLDAAIKLAQRQEDQNTDAGRLAAVLLELMQAAVEELQNGAVSRPSRRGTGPIKYLVEKTQQGEVLTEQKGKSKPYRCPKAVYDALAVAMDEAERPLLLDEIMAAAEHRLGDRPAEHQVRVALRLWTHVKPPLLSRNRARYRATASERIMAEARGLWSHLQASD